MQREVLFRVLMGVGGHEYVIYTNGEVEGFGKEAIVFNYYPSLRALQSSSEGAMSPAPE